MIDKYPIYHKKLFFSFEFLQPTKNTSNLVLKHFWIKVINK